MVDARGFEDDRDYRRWQFKQCFGYDLYEEKYPFEDKEEEEDF